MEILLANRISIGLVLAAVVAGLGLTLFGIVSRQQQRFEDRFQQFLGERPKARHGKAFDAIWSILYTTVPQNLAERLLPNDQETITRLKNRLIEAGIYGPSAMTLFAIARLALMVAPVVMAVLVALMGWCEFSWSLLAGSIGGMLGLVVPDLVMYRLIARRHQTLRRALPDFLDLVVACLESGMGIQPALAEVANELQAAHPDLSREMLIVQGEVQLGRPIDESFLRLWERTALEELHTVAGFVHQAVRFGWTMAGAMRELSDILRWQREQRAEELAHRAAVKVLIPTLVCIFPAIFVVLAGPAAVKIQQAFSTDGSAQSAEASR